ncbi:hypothetical protein SORBI_3010G117850 [Sorghum bicolor]|uniref:Uncharacterized protein n=1 Tax=Sorghum bicolor TaxID=4558 RepID=A0A1W0VSH4_SORBI|nr:hypothetical protein SORBI_3010G117850 [Sorghum bicolor]
MADAQQARPDPRGEATGSRGREADPMIEAGSAPPASNGGSARPDARLQTAAPPAARSPRLHTASPADGRLHTPPLPSPARPCCHTAGILSPRRSSPAGELVTPVDTGRPPARLHSPAPAGSPALDATCPRGPPHGIDPGWPPALGQPVRLICVTKFLLRKIPQPKSPPYEKHAEANQHVQGEEDHDCVGDDYVENEELDDEANQQVPVSSSSTDFFLHAASPAMTSAPARWLSISWDAMTYKWSCVCSA